MLPIISVNQTKPEFGCSINMWYFRYQNMKNHDEPFSHYIKLVLYIFFLQKEQYLCWFDRTVIVQERFYHVGSCLSHLTLNAKLVGYLISHTVAILVKGRFFMSRLTQVFFLKKKTFLTGICSFRPDDHSITVCHFLFVRYRTRTTEDSICDAT